MFNVYDYIFKTFRSIVWYIAYFSLFRFTNTKKKKKKILGIIIINILTKQVGYRYYNIASTAIPKCTSLTNHGCTLHNQYRDCSGGVIIGFYGVS